MLFNKDGMGEQLLLCYITSTFNNTASIDLVLEDFTLYFFDIGFKLLNSLSIFHLVGHQMLSKSDRSGLLSQAVIIHCLAEMRKVSPEQDAVWLAAYVAPDLSIFGFAS